MIGGAPLTSRLFDAFPSFAMSAGLTIWVAVRGAVPSSLEEAVGPFSDIWVPALITVCAVNVVLTLVPKWGPNWYLAEIAVRMFAFALLAGFAVASWSAPAGHRGIQGIMAASVALWHLARWRRLRDEADHQVAAAEVRRRQ